MFHSSPPLRLFFLSHLHPEQRAPNMPATPTEAAAAPVPPQLLAPKEKERDTPVLVRSTTAPPYHTTPHHTPQHRTPHAAHNTQHAVHRVGTSLLYSSLLDVPLSVLRWLMNSLVASLLSHCVSEARMTSSVVGRTTLVLSAEGEREEMRGEW